MRRPFFLRSCLVKLDSKSSALKGTTEQKNQGDLHVWLSARTAASNTSTATATQTVFLYKTL